jgi:hypothetical protein
MGTPSDRAAEAARAMTSRAPFEDLIGAELVFGAMPMGYVLAVRRDPVSQRVWRLVTTYGPHARRVAVPVEWVTRQTPTRVTLAVGARALDDLADERELMTANGEKESC